MYPYKNILTWIMVVAYHGKCWTLSNGLNHARKITLSSLPRLHTGIEFHIQAYHPFTASDAELHYIHGSLTDRTRQAQKGRERERETEFTCVLFLAGDNPAPLEALVEGLVEQLQNPSKPSQISPPQPKNERRRTGRGAGETSYRIRRAGVGAGWRRRGQRGRGCPCRRSWPLETRAASSCAGGCGGRLGVKP